MARTASQVMKRPAITLIELLVVMIILTVLVAAAIPVMAPAVETRRIREAARGVSTFLSSARSRAIELGRPVGVTIERMESDRAAGMVMFIAEMPPPFAGFSQNSLVRVETVGSTLGVRFVLLNEGVLSQDEIPSDLIRIGDRMKLNHRTPLYRVVALYDINGNDLYERAEVVLDSSAGPVATPWRVDQTAQYQIFRQPVRSSAPPYQLPEGAVIDLAGSGVDADTFYTSGFHLPISITFTPSGAVHRVYHEHAPGVLEEDPPISGIFLLIGKPENVEVGPMRNWMDPDTLWVAIGSRTGQTGVTENVASSDFIEARQFARDMRGMGGN